MNRMLRRLSGLMLAIPLAQPAIAYVSDQPPRWINADEVLVRSAPDAWRSVHGTLAKGAEVILKDKTPIRDYCLIEGEGAYGYVACRFLSDTRIERLRAGADGVDPATRWVTGSAVMVRAQADARSPVLASLPLNTTVTLTPETLAGDWCSVRVSDSVSGFVACRYLDVTPVVLAKVRESDPERAFWIQPDWWALESYANTLRARYPDAGMTGPWPHDDALERMKAHLAKGLIGPPPAPYPDWQKIRDRAKPGVTPEDEARVQADAYDLVGALGIWSDLFDTIEPEGLARGLALIRAIELPPVRPSLFRRESAIANPGEATDRISGRFGIVYRTVVTPRRANAQGDDASAGLYDMRAKSVALVRPVRHVVLFRDGRLQESDSRARWSELLWRDIDEEECAGWRPGFAFGDSADEKIWRYFQDTPGAPISSRKQSLQANPAGSLYAFYSPVPMTLARAEVRVSEVRLDRDATGFVRGTLLQYDLDGDTVPDMAVWEGLGRGPGHLGDSPQWDDRWYRLVLVNIDGRWKILGSDNFGYGCGC